MADKRQRAVRAYMRLTGLNYTRAAREMARYTDPTHHHIVAQARHLVHWLESMPRAHDAEFDALTTNRCLTLAVAAARDVEAWAQSGDIGREEFDRANHVSEWLREVSEQRSSEVIAADALVTCVCAVRRGSCSIGHCRPTSCSPAPERAFLVVSTGETRQGCFQHIAEDLVRLRGSVDAERYEMIGPPAVIEAIEALASSGDVAVVEDLETDLGAASAWMLELELEYDLAQHNAECIEAAIDAAYGLGHDEESTVRQAAAQFLEDRPDECVCEASALE
ncbi:hypothetical protein [Kribbella sp. CA-293567]|uniref:hypothetical protein n=1 Tax=Kribbella sp. CA-293567 TaxID=3002436 RepID=UPI0022DDC369|nr:hypothetical protein [Kribbella sp. CA-293567]WBQ04466.1 hypothetical protein OX958_31450 [Kribbella sp. CA-293567]